MTELERTYDLGEDYAKAVVLVGADGTPLTIGGSGASAGQVQGNAVSGATDVGNPVKVGAVFNTTLPTVLTGQRVDVQASNRGILLSNIVGATGTVANVVNSAVGRASSSALVVEAQNDKYNGATWDPDRKPNGTSILPSAANTTNATLVKASAGDLWCISGFNAAASVRYMKIFNKATLPVPGTDTTPTLIMVLALPVGAFNFSLGGHYCSTGIGFALTTGGALLDTGVLTAADIVGLTLTYA